MIQASWADDDGVSREETIRQELGRSLEEFPRSERSARLEALGVFFPSWGQTEVKVVEVEAPPRKPTPPEALEALVSAFPRLSERERQLFSKQLLEAGYKIERVEKAVETRPATEPMEFLPEPTTRKLGLKGQVRVYPTQVFQVLHELVDCVMAVAGSAQTVLQEIYRRAEKGSLLRDDAAQMRVALGRYLSGEPGGGLPQMQLAVGKIRVRLVGVWKLPGALPVRLCERLRPCQPASIEAVLKREDEENGIVASMKDLLKDRKVRCWERYRAIWDRHGLGQIQDSEFWDIEFAEDIISIVEGRNATG